MIRPAMLKRLPPRKVPGRRPPHWLVIVARDEDDIHAKLQRVLAGDRHVRVIFDRRRDTSRNPLWVTRSLCLHGFAVVLAARKGRSKPPRAVASG
jgi:hypothetical protein